MFVKYPSETADKRRNFGTVKFRSNEFRKFTPRQPGGYETGTQSLVVQNAVIRSSAISVYTSHHVVSVSKSVSNQAIFLGGGGDTANFGYSFSNRTHFETCERFSLSSFQ